MGPSVSPEPSIPGPEQLQDGSLVGPLTGWMCGSVWDLFPDLPEHSPKQAAKPEPARRLTEPRPLASHLFPLCPAPRPPSGNPGPSMVGRGVKDPPALGPSVPSRLGGGLLPPTPTPPHRSQDTHQGPRQPWRTNFSLQRGRCPHVTKCPLEAPPRGAELGPRGGPRRQDGTPHPTIHTCRHLPSRTRGRGRWWGEG